MPARPCGPASFKNGIYACANKSDQRASFQSPWGIGTGNYCASWPILQIGRSLKQKPPAGVRVIIWQKLSDDRPPTGQRSANR